MDIKLKDDLERLSVITIEIILTRIKSMPKTRNKYLIIFFFIINNLDLKNNKTSKYTFKTPNKKKTPINQSINRSPLYSERDLNPHNRNGHKILSLACLPFHHPSSL